MGHPSVPTAPLVPPPLLGSCQVRCARCHEILTVAPGITEFSCPKCQLAQMLPPELRLTGGTARRPPPPAQGVDPTKIQLPCARCKAILNVPHGLTRFNCPQCGVDLAVDLTKLHQYFSSVGSSSLPGFAQDIQEETNEVAVDVEREEDEGGAVGETFIDYHPWKLSFGEPHPDPVVETSSLSAVQPPEPTYYLKIMDELEKSKALSCLQIETVVYACQRHLQHLQNGTRAGFFVGDGAGVGKGRTIAGLILENWQHKRQKTLWISVGSDLKFDARRDLDDVGATCIEVHALNKLPYSKLNSKAIGIKDGVVFLTYTSLIASSEKGRSRLQQLLQWCGSDFDGLIVFDECHKAKNLIPEAGGQATRTGEAVLEIQARLPEARVVYCSATGASEPRNLGYMVRLGLWGDGTCFPRFTDFLGALDKGGVGALELVAMDMKARGMYVCRTLSYKGAEFEVIDAPLEEKMMDMYEKAAEFWAELRVELLSASAILPDEKPNSNQLWRLYWASHQRFFGHLCMAAKVPTAVRLAKQALTENKCVVIGLQSTGEARTEEAVTKYGLELDDFVSGPRELLLKLVEENYPLPLKPDLAQRDQSVKELHRKRHSAVQDVSSRGRSRKSLKWETESDYFEEEESETDSDHESFESDEEFQMCEICNSEEEKKLLLRCSCCGQLVHAACLMPPWMDPIPAEWSCYSCKGKTDEYLQARDAYITELLKRYEAANDRKLKILDIIKSLELPNNPLDDLIDQKHWRRGEPIIVRGVLEGAFGLSWDPKVMWRALRERKMKKLKDDNFSVKAIDCLDWCELGGPENVAEMTGRKGILVRASGGKGVVYQARNTKEIALEMVNMHEKQLFMDGIKLVAIISEAGSAGVSLQADKRALNQRRRVHLMLELPWSADRAIQQLGRTHRSNQATAPEYRLLFTNLGGERRFASIVAKRIESLGALTQGDRRAGLSLSAYNYDSYYGKKALVTMYRGIMEQDLLPVAPPGCSSDNPPSIQEFIIKAKAALVSVGIVRDSILCNGKDGNKLSGRIVDSDMHDVGRFLNRLLGLPPDIQNRLFELFISILELLVHNARSEGQFDSGIVDIKASIIEQQGSPKTVHVEKLSGASTVLFTFTVDRGITWEFAKNVFDERQKNGLGSTTDGFYESRREWMGRRHYMLALEGTSSGMHKIIRPAVGEVLREMPLAELKSKYRKVSSIEKANKGWLEEYEVSSKQDTMFPPTKVYYLVELLLSSGELAQSVFVYASTHCMHGPKCKLGSYCTVGRRIQEINVLGGLILPVWGAVEKALSKQVRQSHKRICVVRLETTNNNQRIVGLLIPAPAVESVLQDLSWINEDDV